MRLNSLARATGGLFLDIRLVVQHTRSTSDFIVEEPARKCHQSMERKISLKKRNYFFKTSAEMFPQNPLHYFMEML